MQQRGSMVSLVRHTIFHDMRVLGYTLEPDVLDRSPRPRHPATSRYRHYIARRLDTQSLVLLTRIPTPSNWRETEHLYGLIPQLEALFLSPPPYTLPIQDIRQDSEGQWFVVRTAPRGQMWCPRLRFGWRPPTHPIPPHNLLLSLRAFAHALACTHELHLEADLDEPVIHGLLQAEHLLITPFGTPLLFGLDQFWPKHAPYLHPTGYNFYGFYPPELNTPPHTPNASCDVYALAFIALTNIQIQHYNPNNTPPPLLADLRSILHQATSEDPTQRPSMRELSDQLNALQPNTPLPPDTLHTPPREAFSALRASLHDPHVPPHAALSLFSFNPSLHTDPVAADYLWASKTDDLLAPLYNGGEPPLWFHTACHNRAALTHIVREHLHTTLPPSSCARLVRALPTHTLALQPEWTTLVLFALNHRWPTLRRAALEALQTLPTVHLCAHPNTPTVTLCTTPLRAGSTTCPQCGPLSAPYEAWPDVRATPHVCALLNRPMEPTQHTVHIHIPALAAPFSTALSYEPNDLLTIGSALDNDLCYRSLRPYAVTLFLDQDGAFQARRHAYGDAPRHTVQIGTRPHTYLCRPNLRLSEEFEIFAESDTTLHIAHPDHAHETVPNYDQNANRWDAIGFE